MGEGSLFQRTRPAKATRRGIDVGDGLYVTNNSGGFMPVIDTATNTVSGNGPAGPFPFGLALNPAGTRAYITNVEFDTDQSGPLRTSIPVLVTKTIGP